jgi:hypothetical protein
MRAWEDRKEKHLRNEVIALIEKRGYEVLPIENRNGKGFPDLLCLKKSNGCIYRFFIELKDPCGTIAPLQKSFAEKMKDFKERVYFIFGTEGLLELIEKIENDPWWWEGLE